MRMTRRKVQAWLAPVRSCMKEMKGGEVDAIQGYAVTRLHTEDDYVRVDYCMSGFRMLVGRLCPDMDLTAMEKVEKKLHHGVLLDIKDIDDVMSLLKTVENRLIRIDEQVVRSAVLTEQIAIEMERVGI